MPLTLLIADDDPLMRGLLERALSGTYNVITCDSGTSALAACATHRNSIALALLDFDMPGATGVEVARTIRSAYRIPFVIISKFHDTDSVAQAQNAGALAYMVKPIALENIEPVVRTALARAADLNAGLDQNVSLAATLNESRKALQQIVTADESYRKDLVSDLHDQLGQSLTVMRMDAEGILNDVGVPESAKTRAKNIVDTVTQLYGAVRTIMLQLRPEILEMLSIGGAIAYLARSWASTHTNIEISTHAVDTSLTIESPIDVVLFRATQEALTNISKHADARKVRISFARVENEVRLSVQDDGVGFEQNTAPGIGIIGMREKIASLGGNLRITSAPGVGTTVEITLRISLSKSQSEN